CNVVSSACKISCCKRCLYIASYINWSQVLAPCKIQLANVCRGINTPKRSSCFSWRYKGMLSTYFCVIVYAIADGEARLPGNTGVGIGAVLIGGSISLRSQ